ncbi:NLI interacting factor-like phosphatase family protein, putative [Ichthyophthirius multifiliis]|uniref:Mitochondrial import inner membrane translocase subunit TIM50 n=1 Tax=Ichthyophthirius multifiliis TaxID=5932 RepID=G0QXV4_ICHMU|nr:NLI interacting factor-like phosphatase family protein, putative [Ichthyophthirius multifiliis]EGR29951.1 NLI interacting factor-like phosphatase family protein, putative [Ichthyophthirius multifiliis]|eukprot:XP_004031187.1 NLI interacting factor-like phosphatase family protein, putative [Ichthyophthirius multifiliis]
MFNTQNKNQIKQLNNTNKYKIIINKNQKKINKNQKLKFFKKQNQELNKRTFSDSNIIINQKVSNNYSHLFIHLLYSPLYRLNESIYIYLFTLCIYKKELLKKYLLLTFRGLQYSIKCLRSPSEQYILQKQVVLKTPKNPKGNILYLDLDETLIHVCQIWDNPDFIIYEKYIIPIKIRPFCKEFLQKIAQYWDIYIFTASQKKYANAVCDFLDPQREYIIDILTRENCMETKNGLFIKDLRIIKDKDIKKMAIVDNLSHSYGFQIENGIPILEWKGDQKDEELKYLINYLINLSRQDDVRIYNQKKLKLKELLNYTF